MRFSWSPPSEGLRSGRKPFFFQPNHLIFNITLMRKVIFFLCMSAITATAWAQREVQVNVLGLLDQKPIPGIMVSINNAGIGYSDSAVTNIKGKVTFRGLALNSIYSVTAKESGEYVSGEARDIELRSDNIQTVSIALASKRSNTLGEIVVSSKSFARINTINAEVSSQLTGKELRVLPVEGRDITRALYRLPNVAQATGTFTEANNVSINSFATQSTVFLIDGLENVEAALNQPKFPMPVGFTKNINVLTNNYSVEYGGTYNGIINVSTKSGSNEVSGEAFYLVRPGRLTDGKSKYAARDLTGNPVKDGFQRHQVGFGVGGPIVPNKTFYYINAEGTLDTKDYSLISSDLGIASGVRGKNDFALLSGRIDQFWSDKFKTTLRVNKGYVNIEKPGGGVDGDLIFPQQGLTQDRNGTLVALQNSYTGSRFSSQTDVQYSTYLWNYYRPMTAGLPTVTVMGPTDKTVARLGSPGTRYIDKEKTIQAVQKFTWYRNNHTIKLGLGIISSNMSLTGGGNPKGEYFVKLTQDEINALKAKSPGKDLSYQDIPSSVQVTSVDVELRPAEFGITQNRPYAYLEDLWSFNSKLNLTLGLRYDYDNLSKSGRTKGDYNNIAPRISFNYKLNESSVIRGGYGIYYDKIQYTIYSDAIQFTTNSEDYKKQLRALQAKGILNPNADVNDLIRDGNLKASITGVSYLNAPSSESLQANRDKQFSNELRVLNPDGWQNPYSHQASLGFQKQIDNDKLFYADIMLVDVHNLFRLADLNAPASYSYGIDPNNIRARNVSSADSTRAVPIYRDSKGSYSHVGGDTLRGIARTVSMSESKGRAHYFGISLNYQKDQGADKYAYRFTYTLSFGRNNTESINFKAMDSNNWAQEWGPTNNDRTHIFNGSFYFFPAKNFSLSINGLIQSGMPINRIPDGTAIVYYNNGTPVIINGTQQKSTDLNGDGRAYSASYSGNNDRSPGEKRNGDRLPWSNNFDAAVQYIVKLKRTGNLQFRVDCFNLFNTANLSGYSNNALASNQIQPGPASTGVLIRRSYGPPRQFQFGVNYYF
jgi:TonB dependent receptor/TonB-dependent Receptor Plug Domain